MEPEEAQFKHALVLIRINKLYRPNMSRKELLEATRGVWRININRAQNAEFAMALFEGIIKEVYKPDRWQKADKKGYETRTDLESRDISKRKEFIGELANDDIRNFYIGKFVKFERGNQNPINYVNC